MGRKAGNSGSKKKEQHFINVPVSSKTLADLNYLKTAFDLQNREEVIEKVVGIVMAIGRAARK